MFEEYPFVLQMQCNVFIGHQRSIHFIQISITHLKEDKRIKRERHSNKIYHHGTGALTCELW